MTEGTIKKLTDKGFGFIDNGSGKDMFFHMSNLEGLQFDDLQEGQRVEYTEGQGPKGPRAENVRVLWAADPMLQPEGVGLQRPHSLIRVKTEADEKSSAFFMRSRTLKKGSFF